MSDSPKRNPLQLIPFSTSNALCIITVYMCSELWISGCQLSDQLQMNLAVSGVSLMSVHMRQLPFHTLRSQSPVSVFNTLRDNQSKYAQIWLLYNNLWLMSVPLPHTLSFFVHSLSHPQSCMHKNSSLYFETQDVLCLIMKLLKL